MSIIERLRRIKKFRTLGTASVIVACRIAGSLLTLLYTFLLTMVTPPEQLGTAFAALSTGFVLSVLASLNVESGSIRFLPSYFEKNRPADAAGFMLYCRYVTIATFTILVLVLAAAMIMGYNASTLGPYFFSLAAAPVIANTRINSRHATALGLVLQGSIPSMLVRPVLFNAVLLSFVTNNAMFDATAIMAVFFAACCLTALTQWLLIRRAMTFRKNVQPCFQEAKDWTSLGLLLTPMLLINEYMRDLIILPASLVLPPGDIARLGIVLSVVGVLLFTVTAVDMVFSPKIAKAVIQSKPAERTRLIRSCGALKLGGLALGAPLAYLLIPYATRIIGEAYQGVDSAFLILVAIPFARAFLGPANLVLNIMGRKWELFVVTLGGGIILIGAIFVGAQSAGFFGVIAGGTSALIVYYATLSAICRFGHGINTTVLAR